MNLKKKIQPDICAINRCKAGSAIGSTVNPHGLCEKHLDEWTSAGCPVLSELSKADAEVPADLAVIKAEMITPARDVTAQYLQTIAAIQLDSQAALDWLGAVREGVRQALAAIKEKRTSITKPMNEAKRQVDALFEPAEDGCKAVIKACTDKLDWHANWLRQQQDAALTQIANGNRDDTTIAHAHLLGPALPEQVRTEDKYVIEVNDFAAVPDMFKVLDTEAVLTYAKARHGRVNINGLTISVRVRTRTA